MTPSTLFSRVCTLAAHAAQVIPPIANSNPAASPLSAAAPTGRAEIGKLPGVTEIDVDVSAGKVRITAGQWPGDDALREAIEEAGYEPAR